MDNDIASPRHPIRVVAHRTGLTPATIRAWERRYDAVDPARSEGGQRLYSDRDIERLNTLRALTEVGRSIGTVSALPPEAAEALLSEDLAAISATAPIEANGDMEPWVDDAFVQLTEMNSDALERTLWRAFLDLGAKGFLESVASPLLERVGSSWAAGRVSPAEEHLGSGVLERVLTWMNDPSMAAADGPAVVVATLPGERHALGARLAAVAAAVAGWRATYLGADLPVDEIAMAAGRVGARAVAISAVQTDRPGQTAESLAALVSLLEPGVPVLVGGAGARALSDERLPDGVRLFEGLDAFEELARNGSAPRASG